MTSSRVFSALSSLLFLAVCAYAGAALRGSADGVELMTVSAVTVTESAELDALREGSVVIVSGKETEGSV